MVFIINICIFVEYSRTLGIGLVNSFNQRGPQHLVDKNDQYHQKLSSNVSLLNIATKLSTIS